MYDILVETLILVTLFSLLPMAVIAFVSGIVAFFQTVTQVQEQSVVHLARFIACAAVIFLWGNLALGEIEALFTRVVEASAQVMRVDRRASSAPGGAPGASAVTTPAGGAPNSPGVAQAPGAPKAGASKVGKREKGYDR